MAIGSNILKALPALVLALWGGDGVAEPVTLARQAHSAITDRAEPLLKCALDGTGARYRIAVVPWLRAQAGTKSGEYDGFFVAATNAQRDRYAVLAAPLLFEQWVYVSRKDRGPIEDLVAGESTVFGANTGTARRTWLETQKKRGNIKGTVDGAGTIENTWKMFMHDRIDVLLENAPNLDAMLLELKIPRAEMATTVARRLALSVYFGKGFLANNPAFLARFNNAVERCRRQ
jgi:polar amino acid transport system substrate-binding protein